MEGPAPSSAASASPSAARLQILAGAVLFSTGGAAIKSCDLAPLQVAGLRSGVAALAVLLLLPGARRLGSWRVWAVGLAYAATLVSYVLATKLTTAANAIFLQSTNPLYILLLGPLFLREPIRRRELAYLAAVAAGMALFFVGIEAPRATAPEPLRGNLLAVASGVGFAVTIVGLRWMARGDGAGAAGAAVASGNLLAFLACLYWALPVEASRPRDWLLVGYLGVIQIGLAYALVTRGMSRLPALETSLLLMLEPVLNPVWAFLVHGERPGPWSLAGGAVILVATAVKLWWDVARTSTAVVAAPPPSGGDSR